MSVGFPSPPTSVTSEGISRFDSFNVEGTLTLSKTALGIDYPIYVGTVGILGFAFWGDTCAPRFGRSIYLSTLLANEHKRSRK